MTSPHAVSDALFTDALSGSDGTADPPPPSWRPQVFPDALVAPDGDLAPRIVMPHVPVPEIPVLTPPSMPDWDADLNLPARGSSADRAEAARRAAAARRDASRAGRGTAPAGSQRPRRQAGRASAQSTVPVIPPRQATAPPTTQRPPASRPAPGGYVDAGGYVPGGGYVAGGGYVPPVVGSHPGQPAHPATHAPRPAPPRRAAAQPNPYRARPPARPNPQHSGKKSGAWSVLIVLILFLVISPVGREILDALSRLFNQ